MFIRLIANIFNPQLPDFAGLSRDMPVFNKKQAENHINNDFTPVTGTHRGADGQINGQTTVYVEKTKTGADKYEFEIIKTAPVVTDGISSTVTNADIEELSKRGLNFNSSRSNRPNYEAIKAAFAKNINDGYVTIAKRTQQQEGTVKKCLEAFRAATLLNE